MEHCVSCAAPAAYHCGGCAKPAYCSKACAKVEWPIHESICGKVYSGQHTDLVWVRGTNSSIFLSCYLKNGKWRLLAKGEQFRRRFVAMSETVDNGIWLPGGVNYQGISAYPPHVIRGSGRYAMQTQPYSNEKEYAFLQEHLKPEPQPWPAYLIQIAYALMRIKQYYGDARVYSTALAYRQTVNGQEKERTFAAEVRQLQQLFEIFAADFRLPKGWWSLDAEAKRRVYIDVLNDIRRQFDYWERTGLDYRLMDQDSLLTFVENPKKELAWLVRGERDELLSRVAAIKLLLPDRWPALEAICTTEVRRILYHAELIQIIYDEAVSKRPPVYSTTDADHRILAAPIPFIIASTNPSTLDYVFQPSDVNSQLVLPGKVQISASGANVIIVRSADKKRLKQLLRSLPVPIIDVEIRVDDSVF